MKLSMKKTAIWAAAIAVVAVVLVQPGSQSGKYLYKTETAQSVCVFDTYEQQDIKVVSDSVIITVPIQAPNKCYEAEGTFDFFGNDITVSLGLNQTSEQCAAECRGIVVSKSTISNLDSGLYNLHIKAPDKDITTTFKIK